MDAEPSAHKLASIARKLARIEQKIGATLEYVNNFNHCVHTRLDLLETRLSSALGTNTQGLDSIRRILVDVEKLGIDTRMQVELRWALAS